MVFVWRECIDWSGREREKEEGSEGGGRGEGEGRRGKPCIIHLNTPETPNSFYEKILYVDTCSENLFQYVLQFEKKKS